MTRDEQLFFTVISIPMIAFALLAGYLGYHGLAFTFGVAGGGLGISAMLFGMTGWK